MTRVFRAAWSRRGLLLPLALLGAVVTTGVVLVTALGISAGLELAHAAPLLVLGVVALPVATRDLLAARRGEVALARLRGQGPAQVLAGQAGEPALALMIGAAVGLVTGLALSHLASSRLLVGAPTKTDDTVVVGAVAVVVVGLLLAMLTVLWLLREPLSRQVGGAQRRGQSSTLVLFAQVLVPVAAVVAVLAARSAEDDGWLALAAPALVGLGLGLVAVWLMRVAAAIASSRTGAELPAFLAVRRVARGDDLAPCLCLLVAATVVAGSSLSGLMAQREWNHETARLATGAPVQYPLDLGAHQALDLTRRLDPQGQWLMAATVVNDRLADVPEALIDARRYQRVVGDHLDGTAAADLGAEVAALAPQPAQDVVSSAGDTVTVAIAADRSSERIRPGPLDLPFRPRVDIDYVTDEGFTDSVQLRVDLDGRVHRADLSGCAEGCSLIRVTLSEVDWTRSVLEQLHFGDLDLLGPGVLQVGDEVARGGELALTHRADQPVELVPASTPVPVLATDDVDDDTALSAPGGERLVSTTTGRADALPLVQGHGVLTDIGRMLRGTAPSGNDVEVMVLARLDTPEQIISALDEAASGPPRTLASTERDLRVSTRADRGRVDAIGGLICLAVAAPVLLVAGARGRRTTRREVASLRAAGVSGGTLARAGRRQVWWLALPAAVTAAVGVAVVAAVVRPGLDLLQRPAGAIALPTGSPWWVLLLTVIAVLGLVLAWGPGTRSGPEAATRPVTLWREDRR